MRTTIDLPDHLLKNAKRFALENETTLRELLTQGLELVLSGLQQTKAGQRLQQSPNRLSAHSPLRTMNAADLQKADLDDEAKHLHEVYRRR
jgi:hypothetical protein